MADKKSATPKFSIRNTGSALVPLWVEGANGEPVEELLPAGSTVTRAIHPAHVDYLLARGDVQVVRGDREGEAADLSDETDRTPADNLDTLDLDQLRAVAETEQVDISGKRKNDDIIQAIRDVRTAKASAAA